MSSKEDEIKNASIEDRFKMAIKNPELAGFVYKTIEADRQKNVAEKAQRASQPVLPSPTPVMQGDTRYLTQHRGLHTPTIQEIIADANKPDPTAPYFDTNSDFMREIDPLAPHWSGGEFPRLVNPLKPGPKMPTNG